MTDEGIRYPKNAGVAKRIGEIQGKQYIPVRQLAESRRLRWWGMVLRMAPGAMVREVLLARIPKPPRTGWKGTMGMVSVLRRMAREAGLTDKDLWVRSRWGLARPKTERDEGDTSDEDTVLGPLPLPLRIDGDTTAGQAAGHQPALQQAQQAQQQSVTRKKGWTRGEARPSRSRVRRNRKDRKEKTQST